MSNRVKKQSKEPTSAKRQRRFTAPGILVAVIITVVHVGFALMLLRAQLLPAKYMIPACIALFVLLVLEIFLVSNHKHKGRFWTGFVLSLIMTAVLLMGGLYLNRGVQALSNITKGEQVDCIDVYVLQEDPAQSLEDTAGYTFGVFKCPDYEHVEETIQHINKELGEEIHVETYSKLTDMIDALMDDEVDAIITREGYLGLLNDMEGYETAKEQLRSVYQLEFRDKLAEKPKNEAKSDTFTVYMSGIDTYGDVSARSRSDVNILATINPKTHQILLVSTPRDYFVPLSISDGIPDKLTHAGIYGVDVSMDTVGMIYGIDTDYFFRVNFSGFKDIIDSLGGITVYSDYEFTTFDGRYFSAGENYLDGASALSFARERHSFSEGDRQRGRNQMAVIQGVINKALSPEILKNYNSLLSAVEGNFETSVPYNMVASLVRDQLNHGGDWNIVTYSVNGTGGYEIPYSMSQYAYVMYPDESTVAVAKDLIQQVYDGKEITAP